MSAGLEKLDTTGKRLRFIRKNIACVVRQTSFARFLQTTKNKYEKAEADKVKMPPEIYSTLVNKYYIDMVWLLTGEGEVHDFGNRSENQIKNIRKTFKKYAVELNVNAPVNFRYDADEMRKLRANGIKAKEIAKQFSVSLFTVTKVTRGIIKPLNPDEVRQLSNDGLSIEEIAETLNFSLKTIREIVNKKNKSFDIEAAKKMRAEGMTYEAIGKKLDYTPIFVSKVLNGKYIFKADRE